MRQFLTFRQACLALSSAVVLSACEKKADDTAVPLGGSISLDGAVAPAPAPAPGDYNGPAGGSNTINQFDAMAFGMPSPALSGQETQYHNTGQANFAQVFSLQQLAPLWNNESCSGCHVNGGRSKAGTDPTIPQLLFRVSIPGVADDGGPNPVPGFGNQIQPFIVGSDGTRVVGPEGKVTITYQEQLKSFVDGQSYSLRTPTYTPTASLPANVMISPRIGPQAAGLGLLEAVSEQDIMANADPNDRNNDGITGHENRVWDVAMQRTVIGRFGWKANQPNLLQQAAAAFNGDLGITSPFFPQESNVPGGGMNKTGPGVKLQSSGLNSLTAAAATLKNANPNAQTDIDVDGLFSTAFYTGTLAVPAARNTNDPQVIAGRAVFVAAKCAACHKPMFKTSGTAPYGLGNQTIHPYTDLLLHDMGPGLADNRPDYLASGSEWRTAPLWGTGLSQTTSNHTNYLHDGRARNVMEAIMWHGGEGETSRRYVEQLSQTDRDALVAFVNSL